MTEEAVGKHITHPGPLGVFGHSSHTNEGATTAKSATEISQKHVRSNLPNSHTEIVERLTEYKLLFYKNALRFVCN